MSPSPKRRTPLLVVASLCVVALAAPAAVPDAAAAPVPVPPVSVPRAAGTASPTVTLVTGDQVTVTAGDKVTVQPGPGRDSVRFITRRIDGHVEVMPVDALRLISEHRLDRRLFDVTALIADGFDDRRGDLPLIVTYDGDDPVVPADTMADGTARVTRQLPAANGFSVQAGKDTIDRFWKSVTGSGEAPNTLGSGLQSIWLDGLRRPTLDTSVPQVGAPQAWAAGFDGAGVKVAVLDSGVDADHPDLAGKVVAAQNFTDGAEDALDHTGHGTHVASTVAGTGAAGGGRFKGVAPGATILDGKVCVINGCAESAIIAGMQWAAEQGARVVNLSLGGPDTPQQDPLEQAVERLSAGDGPLFVIAAGNIPVEASVSSPASADAALAVSAVDGRDGLASFSSRGPRVGDGGLKPDLAAPGVDITAARSSDSTLPVVAGQYTTASGTSMATPHVAGGAAIVAQQHPTWSGQQIKATLMASAHRVPDLDVYAQGAGRLDVGAAVGQTLSTTPASLSFGRQSWPHADDPAVKKTITYRNAGSTALTLELSVQATGPDGDPVPAGMLTLDRSTVTVPAGGQSAVTLTADTSLDGPVGNLTGRVVATAGAVTAATTVAVEREVESYELTVSHLGRSGAPIGEYVTVIAGWDGRTAITVPPSATPVKVRLPRGGYAVMSVVTSPDAGEFATTVLSMPMLDVTADAPLTLDSRAGRAVQVSVPQKEATQVFAETAAAAEASGRKVEVGTFGGSFDNFYTAQLGPDRAVDGFVSRITAMLARRNADGGIADSPYAYLLSWFNQGRMSTGLTRAVTDADLATVEADHARQAAGTSGRKSAWPTLPGTTMVGFTYPMPFALPGRRTEYYNVDGTVQWFRSFDDVVQSPDGARAVTTSVAPPADYEPERSYAEKWSRGVFGPTVAAPPYEKQWVTRTGDTLTVLAPMYGDGAGRAGYSELAEGHTALLRDGEKVAETDQLFNEFTVPPEAADYRLEMSAERDGPAALSTRVDVVWTFRSAHVAGTRPARMPLSTVQFAPPVDERNAAPAGQAVTVPVTVRAQPGSAAGANRDLSVEVSYDDGATWSAATVRDDAVVLTHPSTAGFVSLRATGTDTAGNTVRQTVIRAYATA